MLAQLRTALRRPLASSSRQLSSAAVVRSDFNRPGPPRLDPEEQAEFERLVREAEVAPTVDAAAENAAAAAAAAQEHRDLRKGAAPEFEGEVNPKTGEVGGPKRDPFVAGNADWQFGGRVTDF